MKKHVEHYCHGGEETIDKIKRVLSPEGYIGFCVGNIIKYRDRAPYKGDEKGDIEKMNTYCIYLNEFLKEQFGEEDCCEYDAVLGFTYPPLKDSPDVPEQLLKVREEFGEMVDALVSWEKFSALSDKVGEKVDNEEFHSLASLTDADMAVEVLVECEDMIHAIEELQRAVIRRFKEDVDEEYQNDIKAEIQMVVFDKNDERGYYDLA